MNKKECEEKSIALTRKINEIEWFEEDILSLKRKHEQEVLDLHSEFHQISFEIQSLLQQTPKESFEGYRELQANDDLVRQMDHYVDTHLDQMSSYITGVRRQLDDERGELINERNRLKWE